MRGVKARHGGRNGTAKRGKEENEEFRRAARELLHRGRARGLAIYIQGGSVQ